MTKTHIRWPGRRRAGFCTASDSTYLTRYDASPARPFHRWSRHTWLRVAQLTDAEMLNRPHLAAAWEYDWPASRWRQHLNAQLEGTYSLPLIGSWHH